MEYVNINLSELGPNDFTSLDFSALSAYLGVISIAFLILGLITIIELWKIYKKCNKPGWATLIPIYNLWVFLEISGLPGWLSILPVANAIGLLVAYFKLPKRFGKSGAFGLGILFFPIIFLGILAFSKNAKTDSDLGSVETKPEETPVPMNNDVTPSVAQETATPDLMAAETTPMPAPATTAPEPKPVMEEAPALNLEEPVKEETAPQVTPEPVTVNEPVMEEVNAFEMPMPANNIPTPTPEVLSSTPEVLPQVEASPLPEVLPQVGEAPKPELLDNVEELDLPKMANEAINSDINATKTCALCGHVNAYTNKTCEICGATLE